MSEEVLKLPVLKIKDVVLFPNMLIKFYAAKSESIHVIDEAVKTDNIVFIIHVSENNMKHGTIAKIREYKYLPNNMIDVTLEGLHRGESYIEYQSHKTLYAELVKNTDITLNDEESEKYKKNILNMLESLAKYNSHVPKQLYEILANMKEIGKILDTLAVNLPISNEDKNNILSHHVIKNRVLEMMKIMQKELDKANVQNEINAKVIDDIRKQEKEILLKRQLEKITQELGLKDQDDCEVQEYRNVIKNRKLPENIKEKFTKELERLKKLEKDYLEKGVIKNYLEHILDLPEVNEDINNVSVDCVIKSLDKEHYGLEEIKERVIEYVAVNSYKPKSDNMVLCLVGPPGVGKTSIATSIAKSLKRKYSRIPLGGMKDEAELRGHRRTYIGAMPGKIINSFVETQITNPVIILDEIDKVSSSVKGDPYSVLLEVFDYEQNNKFKDYYFDVDYDISNALFICTANSLENIPFPLMDRMEIVFLDGYSDMDKLEIVKKYLVPTENEKYGLKRRDISMSDSVIKQIINNYTREPGIRELTREIEKIYRKAVKNMFTNGEKSVKITNSNLESFLGEERYVSKPMQDVKVGEVMGLAWTAFGGKLLKVQADVIDGCGQFRFTGKIGQVMNESAALAHTYIRMNAEKLGLETEFYRTKDIYIHIPEGAIAKDGPSAGITLLAAMLSSMKDKKLDGKIAMSGEITIKGDILAVGGLKEKITAAIKNNVAKVIIPEENRKDIEKFAIENKKEIEIVFVSTVEQALKELGLMDA